MLGRDQAWNTAFPNDEIVEAAGVSRNAHWPASAGGRGRKARCTAFPGAGLSKVQSVDQRMRLECGVGFRQLRTRSSC